MKQRLIRFGLILAAALVWGAVARRAFAPNTPSVTASYSPPAPMAQPLEVPTRISLTHDPFLPTHLTQMKVKAPTTAEPYGTKSKTTPKPPLAKQTSSPTPVATFNGLIRDRQANRSVALIVVNGHTQTARVGDHVANMRILMISSDSIVVDREGLRLAIRRTPFP